MNSWYLWERGRGEGNRCVRIFVEKKTFVVSLSNPFFRKKLENANLFYFKLPNDNKVAISMHEWPF